MMYIMILINNTLSLLSMNCCNRSMILTKQNFEKENTNKGVDFQKGPIDETIERRKVQLCAN